MNPTIRVFGDYAIEDGVSGTISSQQTLEYNGNQNGIIRAAATAMTQGVSDGPASFSFSWALRPCTAIA